LVLTFNTGSGLDVTPLFEFVQKSLTIKARGDLLPIYTPHRCLIEDEQRSHSGLDGDRDSGAMIFLISS